MNLFTAFRKEWLESLRSYRLLVIVVVLIIFGLTSPIVAKFTPQILATALPLPPGTDISTLIKPATVADAIQQYTKNLGQFELILAVLFSMGAIAQEKDKGTAAMLIVKPLPRGSFIGAKFLGLAAVFAIGIAIAAIGGYYYTGLLFEFVNVLAWLALNLFLFLYVLVILAITIFCSTLTKSQAAAAGISISIIFAGFVLGVIRNFGTYLPGELITWGKRLLFGATNGSWVALAISIGLIVLPLIAAWLVFKRQEL